MPQTYPTAERLALLNAGTAQTAHLMERLSVDMHALLLMVLPDLHMEPIPAGIGITKKMNLCGQTVYNQYGFAPFDMLRTQHADSLRDVACYLLKFIAHTAMGCPAAARGAAQRSSALCPTLGRQLAERRGQRSSRMGKKSVCILAGTITK